jgi:hypothetical protein
MRSTLEDIDGRVQLVSYNYILKDGVGARRGLSMWRIPPPLLLFLELMDGHQLWGSIYLTHFWLPYIV